MDDTIAAISSPPGLGRRTIVRLSGPQAIAMAEGLFSCLPNTLSNRPGFSCTEGLVSLTDGLTLPARAYLFRKPHSYTRQDVVELHLPGGPVAGNQVLSALLESSARQADAGEFTARAFFSGRLDLSQAQSVADVISANDVASLRAALDNLDGRVARLCGQAAEGISEALAIIEASIDFAEENIELANPNQLAKEMLTQAKELGRIAASSCDLPETAHVPSIVLAGRPNVGKSSLLNALAGEDRAMISETAGTTRDVVSVQTEWPGGQWLELLDLAGLGASHDPLAAHAEQVALNALQRADVVCLVTDTDRNDDDRALQARIAEKAPAAPLLIVRNKIDLSPSTLPIAVSCKNGEGLGALQMAITEALGFSPTSSGQAIGLHDRQRHAMTQAGRHLRAAADLLAPAKQIADIAELAAIELRDALQQIGLISGEIVTDDILGKIFSQFCVGK